MTKKLKPTVLGQQEIENGVVLTLKVDADITHFEGHFPSYPLLPGVTQIDWAVNYAKELMLCTGDFAGMDVVKFQEPIVPDAEVELTLKWVTEKSKLYFSYNSTGEEGQVVTHSSGRITLGE